MFLLSVRHGIFWTSLFMVMCLCLEKESSFTERHRVSVPRTSSFQLYSAHHYGWFLCVGQKIDKLRYKMEFLFDDESRSFLRNCSFFVKPAQNCSVRARYQSRLTVSQPGKENSKASNKPPRKLYLSVPLVQKLIMPAFQQVKLPAMFTRPSNFLLN